MRPDILAHARYLAACEVGPDIFKLVTTLALNDFNHHEEELGDAALKAHDLLEAVRDYPSAAMDLGWTFNGSTPSLMFVNERESRLSSAKDWKSLCDEQRIKGHKLDIVEVRIVSDGLASALAAIGEQTSPDFIGLCVWARTRSADLSMDPVIQAVASEQVLLGTANRDKMFARSHVADLLSAARTSRSLMDDAIDAHIYSDDDEIADDCPFTASVQDVGTAIQTVAVEFGLSPD